MSGVGIEELVCALPFAAVLVRGPAHAVAAASQAGSELLEAADLLERLGLRPGASTGPELRADAEPGGARRIDELPVVLQRDGRAVPCVFTVLQEPLHDPAGGLVGVLVLAVEVTSLAQAAHRSAFLAQASPVLLEASLDRADALQRAAELAVPALGELCLINLVQPDGSLRRAGVVLDGPGREEAVRALWATPPTPESPAYRVLRTGQPEILQDSAADRVRAVTSGRPDRAAAIGGLGFAATLVVPLRARGRTLGTLSVSSVVPDRYTAEDLSLAAELAMRASLALDTAALYTSEREAREAAEWARGRTAGLQQLTAALSARQDPVAIAQLAVVQSARLVGAPSAAFYVVEGEVLTALEVVGWTGDSRARFESMELRPGIPATDAVLTGSPVWISDDAQARQHYPDMADLLRVRGYRATACLPLNVDGATLGLLALGFRAAHTFDADEREFLLALSGQCAQALDRSRLHLAELHALEAAEQQRDRLAFLAEASLLLDAPLSQTEGLERLADLAVGRIADWCAVHLVRGRSVEQIVVAHTDPAKVEFVDELNRRYPPDSDAETGAVEVARTGRAQLLGEITDDMLVAAARDDDHLDLIRSLGMRSAMVVPLTVRGRSIGAITLVAAESRQHYTAGDLAFAQDLANRAALALDNVRLYEVQRSIAATLQAALLPAELPTIPGVQVGASYLAQGESNDVGGDLYDVFQVSEASWALLIGDVCGKGAAAASLTALIRHTVRAEANHDLDPEGVLVRLNAAIIRQLGANEARFCTAIYGLLTVTGAATGAARMAGTLACAGHIPPRLVHPDGGVDVLPAGGTLLGVFDDPEVAVTQFVLEPGDTLVMFTDGVTEARRGEAYYGTSRLDALLSSQAGADAQRMAEVLAGDAMQFQDGPPSDDIAVLTLRAADALTSPVGRA